MKTLKQVIKKAKEEDELSFAGYTTDYLKQIFIKWIKQDKKIPTCNDFGSASGAMVKQIIIENWMKRLGIKEEDLK